MQRVQHFKNNSDSIRGGLMLSGKVLQMSIKLKTKKDHHVFYQCKVGKKKNQHLCFLKSKYKLRYQVITNYIIMTQFILTNEI